ncbi:MAG: RNA methyltransferase [Actinobacteria bacterium]|nr:RNA methyltransferase [Actinomycetota bacterium]
MVEGPRALDEAVRDGVRILEVAVEERVGRAAVGLVGPEVPVHVVRDGSLAKSSDLGSSQGVAAVVELPPPATFPDDGIVLVLVDVADPGNVGTLVRAADAAGASAVVRVGGTDPWAPKVVRASAGSVFRLPVVEVDDATGPLERAGFRTVATVARGGSAPDEVELLERVAVLVGNEAHGLADAVVDACDERVSIPMASGVQSLNAAMAGTVVLFESVRQRRVARGGGSWT